MSKILSVATARVFTGQFEDINHLKFPRVDYIVLQKQLLTKTLDYSSYDNGPAGKLFRNIETQLRTDLYLATISWLKSHKYPKVFTWSERAGIPLAVYKKLLRSTFHFVTMFQCWSERQEAVICNLGLFDAMDDIIVHCSSMKHNLVKLGAPAEKIKIIHYSVDQCFFSPLTDVATQKGLVMSIGEPRSRDYPALFRAVHDLKLTLQVPAYGHWYAREKNNSIKGTPPDNVTLSQHLSQMALRDLYARSQFVVLPIRDLVYSAGATATLEAGCMARAVIAFRSRGITDYIIDGETGILVEPGNVSALREAIQFLLANPEQARRMGENARQRIVEDLNIDRYIREIADVLI